MQPTIMSMIEGAISIELGDGWIKPWRLPHTRLGLFPPEDGIALCAGDAAGVRLCFATASPWVELSVLPGPEPRLFDLAADGRLIQTVTLNPGEERVRYQEVPSADSLQIWLPQTHPVALRRLTVDPGRLLENVHDSRPRWVTYGSSITQCKGAHSPARTWPALVAREHGLNLTCLGYGGNCHIEPMVARLIRDIPADIITLELGINVQGAASLSPRTLQPAVIGFVQIIRERHPDIPIALISPIVSPPRENTPNAVGMSLRDVRAQLREAFQRLVDAGDSELYYFDGKTLFGEDLVGYLPDLLHPDGEGYEILGRRISEQIFATEPFRPLVRHA